MLTQYCLTLKPEQPCVPRPEWGYRMYAALLEEAPDRFGAEVHREAVTPLSQFVTVKDGVLTWRVSLLGEESEQSLTACLRQKDSIWLKKDRVRLQVTDCSCSKIGNADELFLQAAGRNGCHLLQFQTATAFKSQGKYLTLPTPRLIVQSLIKKWNGCFPECPIEDEDNQGMEAIADGLRYREFHLHDQVYYLKGNPIPGFAGEIVLENRLSGFHRELADVLMLFSGYSGIGIKTALGMGGVQYRWLTDAPRKGHAMV